MVLVAEEKRLWPCIYFLCSAASVLRLVQEKQVNDGSSRAELRFASAGWTGVVPSFEYFKLM